MIKRIANSEKSFAFQAVIGFSYALLLLLSSCDDKRMNVGNFPENQSIRIESLMKNGHVTGGQVLYFEEDKAYVYSSGFDKLSDSSLVTEATVFQAGALGHQAMALLVLKLAEAGILNLNDKVRDDYNAPTLEKFPAYENVTYKNILSHTSGISPWEDGFDFPPDSGWSFSQRGYQLLAKTLEVKMQTPFHELMKKWVFNPLSMTNSYFGSDLAISEIAVLHNSYGKALPAIEKGYSLFTTVVDYGRLLYVSLIPGFLSTESLQVLQIPYADASIWGAEKTNDYIFWSLGFGLQGATEELLLWQWSDETSGSFMVLDPKRRKGLVFLSNSENGLSIANALSELFFDDPIWFVTWLGIPSYLEDGRMERIALSEAYHYESQPRANQVYDDLNNESGENVSDDIFNNVVWSLFADKKLERSLWLINKHVASYASSSNAYMRLGEAEGFRQNYQQSWRAYRKAMELDAALEREILPRFPWYREAMQALQENDEAPIDGNKYVGKYGSVSVSWDGNSLLYSDLHLENIPLVKLNNSTFDLSSLETFRVVFEITKREVIGLKLSYLTGESTYFEKEAAL